MFLNALLVSLAVGVCYFTNEWFCRLFNDKPIIIGTIVGFLLGDPVTGIICGGTYELIFLGAVNIGGTVPSDALTGTAIATTFIILTDMDIEEAMALAIPVGLLMGQVQMMAFIIPSFFNSYIDKLIEDENDKMFGWMVALTLLMRCFFESFLTFLAIYLGTDIITSIDERTTRSCYRRSYSSWWNVSSCRICYVIKNDLDKKISCIFLCWILLNNLFRCTNIRYRYCRCIVLYHPLLYID